VSLVDDFAIAKALFAALAENQADNQKRRILVQRRSLSRIAPGALQQLPNSSSAQQQQQQSGLNNHAPTAVLSYKDSLKAFGSSNVCAADHEDNPKNGGGGGCCEKNTVCMTSNFAWSLVYRYVQLKYHEAKQINISS
jgi:hypothetical protein